MHSEHHHLNHAHIHRPKTWPEIWAFIMGGFASLSLGIVACIAFYTVLAWGGWPLAIITGVAALCTEGVVYLTDMPSEFKKYCHHGIDRDLKNNYIADYLLLDKQKLKTMLSENEQQANDVEKKKILIQKADQYAEDKRKSPSSLNSGLDDTVFFHSISYLCLIYNYKYKEEKELLLLSFYRKRILFYIAMLFALGSGICFGVVGFTHCTIAFSFLLGFAAAATPWWVITLASFTAFAAAFTYTMLMASSLNKVFNGGFNKFCKSIKDNFTNVKKESPYLFALKVVLKALLLASVVAAVILVGLASGGMLMDAASNVFVATAQFAAPLVDYIATIVTWVLWIPLMVLFLLYNSWRTIGAIFSVGAKLANPAERAKMKQEFWEKMERDFFAKMGKNHHKSAAFFYGFFLTLGFLVAFFFFALHVVSEGALAGEGAKGEADFFSNVFLRTSEIIAVVFKAVFSVVLIIPAVTIAVVLSTVVEVLEDLPYFASNEEDDEEEGHDHHTFIIAAFGAVGGGIINFFSHNGLPKLLGVAGLAMIGELLISASVAWINQSAFWGISAAMAPSIFAFSALLLATLAVIIYFSVKHEHVHYEKLGGSEGDSHPTQAGSLKGVPASLSSVHGHKLQHEHDSLVLLLNVTK